MGGDRPASAPSGGAGPGGARGHGYVERADDPALPPAVLVAVHDDSPATVVREVRAGAEEQGVPTALVEATDAVRHAPVPGDGARAGRAAAGASRLEVGIGIAADGAVAVHHALVPDAVVALPAGAGAAELRVLGGDAARIVTGLPLRTDPLPHRPGQAPRCRTNQSVAGTDDCSKPCT